MFAWIVLNACGMRAPNAHAHTNVIFCCIYLPKMQLLPRFSQLTRGDKKGAHFCVADVGDLLIAT